MSGEHGGADLEPLPEERSEVRARGAFRTPNARDEALVAEMMERQAERSAPFRRALAAILKRPKRYCRAMPKRKRIELLIAMRGDVADLLGLPVLTVSKTGRPGRPTVRTQYDELVEAVILLSNMSWKSSGLQSLRVGAKRTNTYEKGQRDAVHRAAANLQTRRLAATAPAVLRALNDLRVRGRYRLPMPNEHVVRRLLREWLITRE